MSSRNVEDGGGVGSQRDGAGSSPRCRWQDSIASHALGGLPPLEVPGLIEHLHDGCPTCADEQARVREAVAAMDAAWLSAREPLPMPDPALRAELFARLAAQPIAPAAVPAATVEGLRSKVQAERERPWRRARENPGRQLGSGLSWVPAGDAGFEPTAIAGIDVKVLSVDAQRRCVTMLVRMAAGTSYPPHRHAAREECYVISGEVEVGGRTLHAGDYQVAEKDCVHGVQSTRTGCELLIVSSQDDEWA